MTEGFYGSSLNNLGTIQTSAGARFILSGGTTTNQSSGVISNDGEFINNSRGLINDGIINGAGTYTQSMSGSDVGKPGYRNALINNGTFTQSSINIQRGVLGGDGTINGDVILSGLDAIFVGNGTINGNVTIGNGISTETHPYAREHIAPGNSTGDRDTVDPEKLAGSIEINGDYYQLFDGIYDVDIGGYTQGEEYDWLNISGTASLAGSLNINLLDLGIGEFTPILGDTFDILVAETISGIFDDLITSSLLDTGLAWDMTYILDESGDDIARLTVIFDNSGGPPGQVPEPATIALISLGLAGLGFTRRRMKA